MKELGKFCIKVGLATVISLTISRLLEIAEDAIEKRKNLVPKGREAGRYPLEDWEEE